MAALNHSDRKLRSRTGERVTMVNVPHGDRLNNDSRAPFWNGPAAARALLLHAAAQLGDPNTGPAYFGRLRQIHENTTLTGENLRRVQKARSEASQNALERSDIAIDSPRELDLINDVAQIHKELGARLMPELQANGVAPERIIPIVEDVTRRALRAATAARTGAVIAVERPDRLAEARDGLVARLDRFPGDHDANVAIAAALFAAARSGEGMDAARAALEARLGAEPAVVDAAQRGDLRGRTAAEVDSTGIANRFGRLAVTDREGASNEEQINPNAWQNDLIARLDAAPLVADRRGSDELSGLTSAELVVRLARSVYDIEALLPMRVERAPDEQLYDIDESIDPTELARARDRIGGALGEALTADDVEDRDARAAISVYGAMTAEERLEAATTIAMTPSERVELGMKVVGSTPSLIVLPAIELGQGRRDVSMATVEEATVMDALITWASTHRAYPGPQVAGTEVSDMLRDNATSGKLGANTLGLAVANSPALIEHARNVIAKHVADYPDDRLIIHADVPQVGEELMAHRAELLRAAGREHAYADGADATRAFGGWTLEGDQDRLLGQGRFDTDVFVAASDQIMTFGTPSQLDATGVGRANERVASGRTGVRAATKAVEDAIAKLDPEMKDWADNLVAAPVGTDRHAQALEALKDEPRPAVNALIRAKGVLRAATMSLSAVEKQLETIERQNASVVFSRATRGEILMAEIVDGAKRRDKLAKAFSTLPVIKDQKEAETGARGRRPAYIETGAGLLRDQNVFTAQSEAAKLLNGRAYEGKQLEDALTVGVGSRYDGTRNLHVESFLASNFFNRVTRETTDATTGAKRRTSVMRPKLDDAGKPQKWTRGPKTGQTVMEPVIDNRGLEKMIARAASMPASTVFLIEAGTRSADRPDNPAVAAMKHFAKETKRTVVQATAWRVLDQADVISDGRRITTSERGTQVDYGVVASKDGGARSRDMTPQDMKGRVVQMNAGGQMTGATWEAIREYREGVADDRPLTPKVAAEIHARLVEGGMSHLKAPTMPRDEQSDAIMVEAIAMTSRGATIGTDLGSDYRGAQHFGNHDRLGKVSASYGQDGTVLTMEETRAHAYPMAPSISDLTLQKLAKAGMMDRPADNDLAQLVLTSFRGVGAQDALALGERYERLGQILEAAEAGTLDVKVPQDVAHQLGRPKAWEDATKRADLILDNLDATGMSGFTVSSPEYPAALRDAARAATVERDARRSGESTERGAIRGVQTPALFTKGDVDMNVPTVALVVGGDARPVDADVEAAIRIAEQAHERDMAVSIHLSGSAAARIATAVAGMDEDSRPRILLVGDGHPNAHGDPAERKAVAVVTALPDGGYVTATPPLLDPDRGLDGYIADRRSALDLQANHATAVVVVKSTGEDLELLGLRTAINAGKPIAAVGPNDALAGGRAEVADIRFRGQEYSANRRLLAGGDSVTVLLEGRALAFVPNFIPDMTSQAEAHYVPFEGSTAGQMNASDRNRGQDDDHQRGQIESGARMRTAIAWSGAANAIGDGSGSDAFLDAVVRGEVGSIEATPAQIAQRDLANDARFLDRSSRSSVSADVERVFSDIQTESNEIAIAEMQQHLAAQRGSGR